MIFPAVPGGKAFELPGTLADVRELKAVPRPVWSALSRPERDALAALAFFHGGRGAALAVVLAHRLDYRPVSRK